MLFVGRYGKQDMGGPSNPEYTQNKGSMAGSPLYLAALSKLNRDRAPGQWGGFGVPGVF